MLTKTTNNSHHFGQFDWTGNELNLRIYLKEIADNRAYMFVDTTIKKQDFKLESIIMSSIISHYQLQLGKYLTRTLVPIHIKKN